MVDDLVLEDRGLQLLAHLRVLLDELEELTLLPGVLAGLGHHRLGHLGVGHLDLGALADLGEEETQLDPALGQLDVLVRRLDRVVVVAVMVRVVLVPELVGDLLGLGVDQGRRQVERDLLVQRVQQGPLGHRAGGAGVLGLEPVLDLRLQRVEVLGAVALGQLVVDLGGLGFLHGLDGHVEDGGLTGQVLGLVLLGEADLDGLLLTDLHADQLLFEAGDERARAQGQRVVLGGAALEGLAVHLAEEVDHHLVAVLGLGALLAVGEAGRIAGQGLESLLHVLVVGGDLQALDLDVRQVGLGDVGQLFVVHLDDQVVAFLPVLVGHLDLGLGGGAVAGGFEVVVQGAVHGFLHDLAEEALAELLLQQRHRDLALAKALHLDLGPRLFQLGVDLGVEVRGGHVDGVAALEALVQGFGDAHVALLENGKDRRAGDPACKFASS